MKILIATLLLFTVLLGFGTFSYYYIDHTAQQLITKVRLIEETGNKEDWQKAAQEFAVLHERWNTASSKWTALVDHQELDNINISLAKVGEYIKAKDIPGFRAQMAELKILIRHIPEKEALNLKNIF
ncbi:MAG: DUF4363 family protein [Thermincola sp.]|jgi:hypothetical protein|nr:DUF4363 family protein [Thermincola sp.]